MRANESMRQLLAILLLAGGACAQCPAYLTWTGVVSQIDTFGQQALGLQAGSSLSVTLRVDPTVVGISQPPVMYYPSFGAAFGISVRNHASGQVVSGEGAFVLVRDVLPGQGPSDVYSVESVITTQPYVWWEVAAVDPSGQALASTSQPLSPANLLVFPSTKLRFNTGPSGAHVVRMTADLTAVFPTPGVDLGGASAGATERFEVEGRAAPGLPFSCRLEQATAGSFAWFGIGTQPASLPFANGLVSVVPDVMLLQPIDAAGVACQEVVLPNWFGVGVGFRGQWIALAPNAPGLLQLSNARAIVTLP